MEGLRLQKKERESNEAKSAERDELEFGRESVLRVEESESEKWAAKNGLGCFFRF